MKKLYSFGLERKEIKLDGLDYQYGFINKKGVWIIKPNFSYVGRKFDKFGYCIAKMYGLYGFINLRGEWIINAIFDDLGKGFGRNQSCTASFNKNWGVIDRKGNWLIQPKFDHLGVEFDTQGFCPALKDMKWGFIDRNGDWVIDPKFDTMYCEPTGVRISTFNNNICLVQIGKKSLEINRRGLVTKTYNLKGLHQFYSQNDSISKDK
jgi:hypothetical protein